MYWASPEGVLQGEEAACLDRGGASCRVPAGEERKGHLQPEYGVRAARESRRGLDPAAAHRGEGQRGLDP